MTAPTGTEPTAVGGSVPAPPAWQALAEIATILPADEPAVASTAGRSPHQWSTRDAVRLYDTILLPRYADTCRDHGYDTALLSDPRPHLMLRVSEGYPHSVEVTGRYLPPDVVAPLTRAGAQFDDQGCAWLPTHPGMLADLREAVQRGNITVEDTAAVLLRRLAAHETPSAVVFSPDKKNLHLARVDGAPNPWGRVPAARWVDKHHAFVVSATQAPAVVAVADDAQVTVAGDVREYAERASRVFDYDGTIDGLRTVRLNELVCLDSRMVTKFTKMGIETIYDLLTWVPLRYVDRSKYTAVSRLSVGEFSSVRGVVATVDTFTRPRRCKLVIRDDTGRLDVTFFNSTWQARRFRVGDEVLVSGTVSVWEGGSRRVLQMTNPVIDKWEDNTEPFLPIYPQSGVADISTWNILVAAKEALARLGNLTDPVPVEIQRRYHLPARGAAYRDVHLPSGEDAVRGARRRIAFDEMFRLQGALLYTKQQHHQQPSTPLTTDGELVSGFVSSLPFSLTSEQQSAWEGIAESLHQEHPMHRLLQGDVGSGKTMLAVLSALSAVDSGQQAAVMAPTEILATQLHREFTTRLTGAHLPDGTPIRIELLTNKQRGKKRTALIEDINTGNVHITVGTHALLDDAVQFHNLAVVVVDEQHRFGVEQRALLRDKPSNGLVPHTLVMTATPIPRTAAMTVFGDLDVSTITALPPGRQPIHTEWLNTPVELEEPQLEPWTHIHEAVAAGHQAYVVCPLVTESERLQAANAEETHQLLADHALAGLRVGLVHGQQKPDVRQETMEQFTRGELDVLVATTVIEVGVNVPNATVMVILDPARFGIAQLHQLRGRVGRGDAASQCFLVGEASTDEGRQRLNALTLSTDGFHLAEVDLGIRGPGSLLGSSQSGTGKWVIADAGADRDLLENTRTEVHTLLTSDVGLTEHPELRTEIHHTLESGAVDWLHKS